VLGNVVNAVVGSAVPLVRLPVTLLEGVESVLQQLTSVATRAAVVLDAIEDMPARVDVVIGQAEPLASRVDAVVDRAEPVAARIEALLDRAEEVPDRIEALLVRAGAVTSAIEALVASVQPVVTVLAELDPKVVEQLVTDVTEVLPAIRSLEQLVPVVSGLGDQVTNLDRTVADVGAMLGGIPGAARLLKRGETRPRA
jgi:ABC-type transporter Mla subunit MlaD